MNSLSEKGPDGPFTWKLFDIQTEKLLCMGEADTEWGAVDLASEWLEQEAQKNVVNPSEGRQTREGDHFRIEVYKEKFVLHRVWHTKFSIGIFGGLIPSVWFE